MTKRISKQTRRSFVEFSTIGLVGTVVVGCTPSSDTADETVTGSMGGWDEDSSSSDETKSVSSGTDSSGDASGESSSDNSSGSGSESGDSSSENSSGDTESSDSEISSSDGSSGTESGSTEESSGTESDGTDSESTEDEGSDTDLVCEEIDPLIPGPFFQDLAERADGMLDLYDDVGVEFELVGRVLDRDCKPVANASVGMWHASPAKPSEPNASSQKRSATYDHPRDQPDPDPKNEDKYYGRVKVDADGHYRFKSLRPGWYLNTPSEKEEGYYRPAHLHIKVFMGTQELLITQLFFDDDPELMNDVKAKQDHLFNARNVLKVDASGKTTFDLIVNV